MVERPEIKRSGIVALIGRSNVGKSTLLNAALEMPLAIVSHKPQTTRMRLLGIVRHAEAEIGVLDTPGLHRAKDRLGKEMNRVARIATNEADVVVFVVAVGGPTKAPLKPHAGDLSLLKEIDSTKPVVLVINKIDQVKDKTRLLPMLAAFGEQGEFAAVVPISALRKDGIVRVLDEVAKLLPEGQAHHDEDAITDRPLRFFVAEYVREPILAVTSEEVPHAVVVTVDRYSEASATLVHIDATIHVEREGQKRIIIGKGGAALKQIGIRARQRIEELVGRQVNLKLWVRVTANWREKPAELEDFGLMSKGRKDV